MIHFTGIFSPGTICKLKRFHSFSLFATEPTNLAQGEGAFDCLNFSSAIGAGLGAASGSKFSQLTKAAGGNTALANLISGLKGLGTTGFGLFGNAIGRSTGF